MSKKTRAPEGSGEQKQPGENSGSAEQKLPKESNPSKGKVAPKEPRYPEGSQIPPSIKKIPMRELEKMTNLSRATIRFYIKEGLLPVPQKSAKNMAYYDENFVEKVKFIEKMKQANFTLTQIKHLICCNQNTVNDFGMQVMESVNSMLSLGINEKPVTIAQLKTVGFDDDDMAELIELRIVNAMDNTNMMFPAYSLTACRFVRYFLDFGIPATVTKGMLSMIRELADFEKNIFFEYIKSPMLDNNVSQEEQRKEIQRCIENINGLLTILHLQFLKLPSEDLRKSSDPEEEE